MQSLTPAAPATESCVFKRELLALNNEMGHNQGELRLIGMTSKSSRPRKLPLRTFTLIASLVINVIGAVLFYVAFYTPYLDSTGLRIFQTNSCNRDRAFFLSHEARDAQAFFKAAVCNEGLRQNGDGTFTIDNSALK